MSPRVKITYQLNVPLKPKEVIYKTDHILGNHGHTVVWLLLCMCDPSHIVIVMWPKIKRLAHDNNVIIDMNLLKLQVTNASVSLVTRDDCQEFCICVENVDKRDRQHMYNECNTEPCSHNHCCCGKAISIKYYECVCLCSRLSYPACKSHLLCFILSSVACLAVPYFSTVSCKQHVKCVLIFSTDLSETPSFWEEFREVIMYIVLHVKYPTFLSDFGKNLYFLDRYLKSLQISNFMKIVHWEPSCSMWKDR